MSATDAFDPADLAPRPGTRLAVVGGCGGIGRALVAAALKARLRVAVLDLPASLAAHPAPPGVLAHGLDATREADVAAGFAALDRAWGGLDALVNLAGFMMQRRPFDQTPQADWRSIVDGSLETTQLVARAALPLLRRTGGGAIVHTASGLAYRVLPGYAPYSAAKAGVIALTKAIALENAPTIRANVIAPGAVDTEFLSGGTGRDAMAVQLDRAAYLRTIPLGRIADANDVVGPILFLLGAGARYMTGQVLMINGGGQMP